ncbi:uncharacterized protein LOC134258748 [Saccostrea cucullata]|uniref:uncharacterized protein LOC134258748 n=1 Tax=Saccostrea cuccullata TaxID=36930 RepID=UPI002ED07FA6
MKSSVLKAFFLFASLAATVVCQEELDNSYTQQDEANRVFTSKRILDILRPQGHIKLPYPRSLAKDSFDFEPWGSIQSLGSPKNEEEESNLSHILAYLIAFNFLRNDRENVRPFAYHKTKRNIGRWRNMNWKFSDRDGNPTVYNFPK